MIRKLLFKAVVPNPWVMGKFIKKNIILKKILAF